MTSKDKLPLASRRDFAKLLGLGAAASAIPLPTRAQAETDGAGIDALARLAIDGSSVRLGPAEMAALKRSIEEDQKAAAALREVALEMDVLPAMRFHPK